MQDKISKANRKIKKTEEKVNKSIEAHKVRVEKARLARSK